MCSFIFEFFCVRLPPACTLRMRVYFYTSKMWRVGGPRPLMHCGICDWTVPLRPLAWKVKWQRDLLFGGGLDMSISQWWMLCWEDTSQHPFLPRTYMAWIRWQWHLVMCKFCWLFFWHVTGSGVFVLCKLFWFPQLQRASLLIINDFKGFSLFQPTLTSHCHFFRPHVKTWWQFM